MTVGIINYGMGNLSSVSNAFASLNSDPKILARPEELRNVDRIVLPGVGAFGDGMAKLRGNGWIPELEAAVLRAGKPFLGLCLGMQMLASTGTEYGHWAGLGWIPGLVRRLTPSDPSIRVPHMGWNDLEVVKMDGLYRGMKQTPVCYFVHSYVFQPEDPALISAYCNHGERFAASLEYGNIFATQYHPEKSQKNGLAVLSNFLAINPVC
jgi:imidazole glycerol-phosphate synthase subunit HisH